MLSNSEEVSAAPDSPKMTTPQEQANTTTSTPDLEKLGKKRPQTFSGLWPELAFCFSIVMSQILAVSRDSLTQDGMEPSNSPLRQEFYITGSNVLLPTLVKELGIPAASTIWPTTALSLAVTSTLLIFGRLTDMYGGYAIYNTGAIWLTISSILCGVSQTWLMLIVCRALQGLALGALLPSGMMILGSTYRPGPRKNLVFSIYGACAALGFFAGFFVSGICGQYLSWRWYFFIGAILSAVMALSSLFYIHRDYAEKRELGIRMDWIGFCLSISGATLFVFAIADSSYAPQGWRTPYIPVLFAIGAILLGVMAYLEGWVIENPLLPGDIFRVKFMTPLVLALLCLYGSLGIFLLYGVL